MQQENIRLEIIKQFTNSLDFRNGRYITKLGEDDFYEFKKSFQASQHGISKDYLKTIAGFSNNKGGIIIFGIDPDSQELLGINDKYENYDNKYINTVTSEFLDGMGSFYFFTHRHEGKLIGFLKINQPIFKPVIVKSNFNHSGENYVAGDIYFRYPGEVLKIKPSDLRTLMSNEINRHAQKLIEQINSIVKIGPENVAIINSKTGEVDASNSKLMLSPEILKDLNLIMEGNFVEKDGAPAYVIKGNIELEAGGSSQIIKETVHTTLHNRDYHLSLLDNECISPETLISEIVYRDTAFLPIYNLIEKANFTIEETIDLIESQTHPDVKKGTKTKILERLRNPSVCLKLKQGSINLTIEENQITKDNTIEKLKKKYGLTNKYAGNTINRTIVLNGLKAGLRISSIYKKNHLKEVIEAFSHLEKEDIIKHKELYFSELKSILLDFNDELNMDNTTKNSYRRVMCLIDYISYNLTK